jgi:hypothetical protein
MKARCTKHRPPLVKVAKRDLAIPTNIGPPDEPNSQSIVPQLIVPPYPSPPDRPLARNRRQAVVYVRKWSMSIIESLIQALVLLPLAHPPDSQKAKNRPIVDGILRGGMTLIMGKIGNVFSIINSPFSILNSILH